MLVFHFPLSKLDSLVDRTHVFETDILSSNPDVGHLLFFHIF